MMGSNPKIIMTISIKIYNSSQINKHLTSLPFLITNKRHSNGHWPSQQFGGLHQQQQSLLQLLQLQQQQQQQALLQQQQQRLPHQHLQPQAQQQPQPQPHQQFLLFRTISYRLISPHVVWGRSNVGYPFTLDNAFCPLCWIDYITFLFSFFIAASVLSLVRFASKHLLLTNEPTHPLKNTAM